VPMMMTAATMMTSATPRNAKRCVRDTGTS
jgi:hypothetical protein